MRRFPRLVVILLALVVTAGLVFAAKTCPKCGATNKDSDKFCKVCGAKLPEPPPPRTTPRVSGTATVSGAIVRITSQPPGAGVNVDGKSRGRTPLELRDLGPGRHDYELTRGGYRPFYGEFTITGQFGSIVVTTEPIGAEVLLDGKSRGIAPDGGLSLPRVMYGRHTITARLEGYDDAVRTLDLKSAGPVGVTCRLGYGKGWLVLKSDPPGASALVNERPAGSTPCVAELEPARYELRFKRRGYYDWVGDSYVQYAESTTVNAILDRIETRKLPLLIAAVAGLGAGVGSTLKGESEYAKYRAATSREDAERYHLSTTRWDLVRTAAFGASLAMGVAYLVVKW